MKKKGKGESEPKRIEFKLDNNLIHHLVDRQSATPEKAILELVMNAADAKASRVDITITDTGFEVVDDGRGFASEEEIHTFFATFGTPQTEEKTYGRYRVGRAQIFGWATTTWESNGFQMVVDLGKDHGGFELHTLSRPFAGCRIRGAWNRRVHESGGIDAERLTRAITAALLFPPVEIWIGGNLIAKPAKDQEWTSETPEAYFRLGTSGPIRLFNQGVFVCELPHHRYHVGGVVLTKKAIELTMARNEPLEYERNWNAISRHLSIQANNLHAAGASVGTDEFRAYALRRALQQNGDLDVACVTTIPKRHVTLREFLTLVRQTRAVAFASRGEVAVVEAALRSGVLQGAALHFDSLDRVRSVLGLPFTLDDQEAVFALLNALEPIARREGLALGDTVIYSARNLPKDESFGAELDGRELHWSEARFLHFLDVVLDNLSQALGVEPRFVKIAETEGSVRAYTDGFQKVVYSRRFVEEVLSKKPGAALEFVLTYVHELCHLEDSRNAGHDDVFYGAYHRLTVDHARAIDDAVRGVNNCAMDARPPARLTTRMLPEAATKWFEPGMTYMSDDDRLRMVWSTVKSELQKVATGERKMEDLEERLTTLAANFVEYEARCPLVIDEIGSVEPMRLCGPVLWLMLHEPFDRPPTKELLAEFLDPQWSDLVFDAPYFDTRTPAASVSWGRHRVGTVAIKQKGYTWKPGPKMPPGFPTIFAELCERFPNAFPWSERRFERDLAWAMLACMTIRLWERGTWQVEGGRRSVRVRRAGDPKASFFTVRRRACRGEYFSPDVDADWRVALVNELPGLTICSGQQLLAEALEAFAEDAQAVKSESDVMRFWLKWGEAR